MMKNSKLKFSEYMQNISRSNSFGKFVLIVWFSTLTFDKKPIKTKIKILPGPSILQIIVIHNIELKL